MPCGYTLWYIISWNKVERRSDYCDCEKKQKWNFGFVGLGRKRIFWYTFC